MKRYDILVLTPATVRPHVLRRTFSTFQYNMFSRLPVEIDMQLALHIDSVGEIDTTTCLDVFLVAQSFFDIYNIHKEYRNHSLSNSFYWLWETANKACFDYGFYLEDDWELLKSIDLLDMIEIMEKNKSLASLRLPHTKTAMKYSKEWSHFFEWTGSYFKCSEKDKPNIGWCGHPNLFRFGFVADTLPLLNSYSCPERQMKGLYGETPMKDIIMKWDYGVYAPRNSGPVVRDIGRRWRVENHILKNGDTSWRKAGNVRHSQSG